MIRKYIVLALLGIGSVISADAFSFSLTVSSGTLTNLFPLTQGSAYLTSVAITPTGNGSVVFYDTPTNSLTYINAAYTNRFSYATNYINTWTNFYGEVSATTNIALIDIANPVPATTNAYSSRASIAALAGTTAIFPNVNAYFSSGIWVTNTGTNSVIVTVTGRNGE